MKTLAPINAADQVKGAITVAGRPLTMMDIYQSCTCFDNTKDCAKLLNDLDHTKEIVAHRPTGERARYAMPDMKFTPPAKAPPAHAPVTAPAMPKRKPAPAPTRETDIGIPPNSDELATARHISPVLSVASVYSTDRKDASLIHREYFQIEPVIEDEIANALDILRGHLSADEYRGYLRGNLIALALRGHPEDLKRQSVFGQALAGVV